MAKTRIRLDRHPLRRQRLTALADRDYPQFNKKKVVVMALGLWLVVLLALLVVVLQSGLVRWAG